MKRLIFVVCALFLLATPAVALMDCTTALAAPRIVSVDAKAMIGMTTASLYKKYGAPQRTEPSEYGFTWCVYSRDYKNYFMAGVRSGKVVAVYDTARTLSYGGSFKLGSAKAAVRAKMGKPVSFVRSGNKIAILPNANQMDMFPAGNCYVIAFYDTLKGNRVTSVMVLPKADENRAMTGKQALSAQLVAAYQRISADLVNAARAKNGLRTLKTDAKDARLALSRSTDMRNRNYFSHYTPENKSPADLARKMGIRFTSLGENIAYGNNNAVFAHEAFMNSSAHRSNVLKSSYTKMGAGAASGGTRYVILTDIFSR